jgi:glycerol-3-phosphate dehydrogenase
MGIPDFDVAVIGAGVSGANIVRKLSSYRLDIALLEKECDVSFGVSKANSGIIHGGFHHGTKYLKARLEIQGHLMFDRLQKELGFPYKRCGIIVAALNDEELLAAETLYRQGVENGAIGIEMCSRERALELEPKLTPDVVGGVYAPGGGIIEPYRFVFSLVESARKNKAELMTGFKVSVGTFHGRHWEITAADGRKIRARYAVNAAGLYADEVSRAFGAEDFSISPRKGEYFLLDRMTKACPDKVIFPVPTPVSKGMLVIPTVEGTVLVGPTAEDNADKEDFSTKGEELERIFDSARRMVPRVSINDVITTFAGQRPALSGGDFYIDFSEKVPQFVQVAGIQSPGLTASPAIGEYVKDLLKKGGCSLTEKSDFDPFIDTVPRIRDSGPYEADALVKKDPRYGNIVCRCEKISEAEIVAAIKRGHTTLDGIKYFTRSGMGRCQGGFCTYKILKIIMRETGMAPEEVSKRGGGSYIVKDRL